jgi:hypothetical protein
MTLYFLIENGTNNIIEPREYPAPLAVGQFNTKTTAAVNGKPFLEEVSITDPAYDPATQVKDGPVDDYDGTTATRVYTVRAKNAAENTADDKAQVLGKMLDLGYIVTKLVDVLIAKGTIVPTDFDAETRQEYQDLKTIIDRLRP